MLQAQLPGVMLLSELTTLRLGGPACRVIDCCDEESLIAAVQAADDAGDELLILGGGSNVVVADEGFRGTVARVLSTGVSVQEQGGCFVLDINAGESWDRLVERCVRQGLAGIECLSGIPGLMGATPIQNVGAYGQEVCQTLLHVRIYDRLDRSVRALSRDECGFAYRSSIFKRNPGRWVVLGVRLALQQQRESRPVRYAELARILGVETGQTAPLHEVREAVLALRRSKGMVLDPADPDTVSAGSFFLNPVLTREEFERLALRVQERIRIDARPPAFPDQDGRVKTSAAWLIQHAGFHCGYGNTQGIAISSKHTLVLTNRGQGTTTELVALARNIADGVERAFGVELTPEPVFVGHSWPTSRQGA